MNEYTAEELNKVRLKKDGVGIHEIPLHFDYLEQKPELKLLGCFDHVFYEWGETEDSRVIARNKIIRYINYMYSMEITCIRKTHPQYREQKVECALLAGFDHDGSGKFKPEVEDMLGCKDQVVNRMIITFLRHSYSDAFAAIVTLRELYYRGMAKLLDNQDSEAAGILEWTKTQNALQKMEVAFLAGDDSKPLTAALIKKIEEESLGLRPEDIAFRIKAGKDPLEGFDFYDNN